MNRRFEIPGLMFQIAPDEQIIYEQQGRTFTFDGGGHGHGYEWVPCTDIDFKTTTLVFMGSNIGFKKFFTLLPTDISSSRIIYQSIGYDNDFTVILSPLENAVYTTSGRGGITRMDISGYTYIGQLIFKNKAGKLFFFHVSDRIMNEITIPVDETSLQHIFSNNSSGAYYTDKNGLYFFPHGGTITSALGNGYRRPQQQLESSNGKPVQAVLHDRYFIYGDAAYPYGEGGLEVHLDMKVQRLNANKLNILNLNNYYITDDDKSFVLPSSRTTLLTSASPADAIQQGRPQEPFSEWNLFDFFVVNRENLKNNTVYYPTKGMNMSGSSHYLIKTPSGFYGINRNYIQEAVKYDNVMIYNIEIEDYEPIEVEHFRRLTGHFHIYKNRMYYTNSEPIETELDIQKLQAISLNGRNTEFYTDGTFLVGGYNLSRMVVEQRGKQEWRRFEKLFRDVDWESLQIVSEKVMIDKNNIYKTDNSFLEIIPIKELGLEVIVIPLMDR
jgi:hypothetical protein